MSLSRFEAWWDCRVLDRPPVTMRVENRPAPVQPALPVDALEAYWMDAEGALDRFEKKLNRSCFLSDTPPIFFPNLGPYLCSTLFGGKLGFSETTSWFEPIFSSSREVLDVEPDFNGPYWTTVQKMTALSLAKGRGKWLTGLPDFHTNADLLASLVGSEKLCIEMLEDPDTVHRALSHLNGYFEPLYNDFYRHLEKVEQPATTWTPFLHAGKAYVVSCDFICLLSPSMFKAFVLPALEYEVSRLERSIFHLDGPGALKHLDAILSIPRLNAVQWVYGAGQEPAAKWVDVYKTIQAAGKAVEIICDSPADAAAVMEHLKPEGVWLHISGTYSAQEAEAFIKSVSYRTNSMSR